MTKFWTRRRSPNQEFIDDYEILSAAKCIFIANSWTTVWPPPCVLKSNFIPTLQNCAHCILLESPKNHFPLPPKKILDPQPAHLWISPSATMTPKLLQQ